MVRWGRFRLFLCSNGPRIEAGSNTTASATSRGTRHPLGVEADLTHLDRMFGLPPVADEHRPMTAMERIALRPEMAAVESSP